MEIYFGCDPDTRTGSKETDKFICEKCKKEMEIDLKPGLDKPVQSIYYDEKTFKIICKECYEKEN